MQTTEAIKPKTASRVRSLLERQSRKGTTAVLADFEALGAKLGEAERAAVADSLRENHATLARAVEGAQQQNGVHFWSR